MSRSALALLFALLTSIARSASPLQAPENWTQFRLNSANNAVVAGSLEASWRLPTGGAFSSSPSIVRGTVYVGNNSGLLYAVDAATGRTSWIHRESNPLMAAPLVYNGLVIAGEGNENSPPQSTPSHPLHVGDGKNALIALDARSGAVRWISTLHGTGMPTPAIISGVLVHHDGAGIVLGLDPRSGRELYSRNLHSLASMVAALPMPNGNFVTTGVDQNAVWMLRARDGTTIWRSKFSPLASGIGDCPPVSDGTRIFCDYAMPPSAATPVQTERFAVQRLYALDVRTGKRLWDVALESGGLPKRNEAAIPLVALGTLFVGSSLAPWVHAVDPASGRILWRVRTGGVVKGGIVCVGNTIYFGDAAGYLWALDANNGRVLGRRFMNMPFNVGSPVVAGQTLIIGSLGGTLLAIPLRAIRDASVD